MRRALVAVAGAGLGSALALAGEPEEARGEWVYAQACAPCHGLVGDGAGPAARGLEPRPRDLSLGVYKLRSTRSGAAPTDADLRRTIDVGVPGTSMPAWRDLLSEADRDAVVAYVRTLSDVFAEEAWPDDLLVAESDAAAAPAPGPEGLAAGAALYERMQCAKCHGSDGRGNPDNHLVDSSGLPIRAFDLTRGGFKGGDRPIDVYRAFTTGLDGTPMPSYADALGEAERWQLVLHVQSLRRPRGLLDWLLSPPTANHPPPARVRTPTPTSEPQR